MKKNKCLLLIFIYFVSSKLTFTHKDLPFIYSQLFILFKFLIPRILYISPFIKTIFALFNSLQVANICFVSFVIDNPNKIPSAINLK